MNEEPKDEADEDLEEKLRAELDEALLALDELAHQDPEEALSMFDSLPEPVQALPDFQLLLARAHQAMEQLDVARDLLEGVLNKTPSSADAHHLLGDVLEDLGQSDAANRHFLETLQLDGRTYAAVASQDRKRFEGALRSAADALTQAVSEVRSTSIETLPTQDAVVGGQDPRALVAPADASILYAANLFAEFGDLLEEPALEDEILRAALRDCAETWGWSAERRQEFEIDDEAAETDESDLN